jgi:biopolymer transport protein ExbB
VTTETTLADLMQQGGWVMWALLVLSAASLAVALERWWALRRARVPVAALADALRRTLGPSGSPAAALDAVHRTGGPAARVLATGLRRVARSPAQIETAMERSGQVELRRLGRRLGVLASTAVTAPLLGFLGTVTGMIAAFDAIGNFGTANPELVAIGIKEALVTTAAGLMVAVPVHLLHHLLASRVARIAGEIEDLAHLLLELREEAG